jgi:hypothetical protein
MSETVHASADSTVRWFVQVFGAQIDINTLFGDSAEDQVSRSTKSWIIKWPVLKTTLMSPQTIS